MKTHLIYYNAADERRYLFISTLLEFIELDFNGYDFCVIHTGSEADMNALYDHYGNMRHNGMVTYAGR